MDLSTLETRKQKLAIDAKAMLDAASKERRGLSDDETKQYDTLFKELEHVDKSIVKLKGDQSFYQKLDEITQGKIEQHIEQHVDKRLTKKSFGHEVIEHKAFKDVIELAKRSRRFESDLIEVKAAPVLDGTLWSLLNHSGRSRRDRRSGCPSPRCSRRARRAATASRTTGKAAIPSRPLRSLKEPSSRRARSC